MAIFKSKNPALGKKTFEQPIDLTTEPMTIEGTVNKTFLLGLLVVASAALTWNMFTTGVGAQYVSMLTIGGAISGLIVAIIIISKKSLAPTLAPVYAVVEGLCLGGISVYMEMSYSGIVMQAILITLSVLFGMLFLYKYRIIRATENFKLIVGAATLGIFLVYLISFVGSFFNFHVPYLHENGPIGIGISLFIVVIAALNLVIDFDFVEEGASKQAPKYMEWYAAFGIMVTLIWLYLEILRLLSKFRD
ncbi:MAG: Bax inhibitor-1/YccA family protein [Flavobacteriaceae bacterium]|nr:Bax inhibitor-1/YccA family protein [Flavobacteriaceae bacterium]